MKRIITIFVSIYLLFCSYISLATASSFVVNTPVLNQLNELKPSIPNISNWNLINISRIELRISDCASIYIGMEAEYNNPSNSRDFVRVVSRHISLPISKCRNYNKLLLSETVARLYAQKEEQDLLAERSKKSDPLLYIQWQTVENLLTGRDTLTGDVNIWFMPAKGLLPNGSWLFFKNEKIKVEFLTENVGNGEPHNVFSGRRYGVGDYQHIIRVNRNDIVQLLGEEK